MDSAEFNRRYFDAFNTLGTRLMTDLLQTQRDLQALAKTLPDEAARLDAEEKVHELPTYLQPMFDPMTLDRREAELVLDAADHTTGTKEERLAAIDATRKKIWAIADRAGEDAHQIRYMTRRLDTAETDILDSNYLPWNDDYDQGDPHP
ncbi:hypothetical protein [Kribbella sp. VKM Ac-2568]|uniref:hypothetical protein n=1 Tax=Kribbella sp. VKM Ac-2568 TaxID=2512219 RepID=UPI001047A317|nr:hypothetical protein [Kribbella sp. VKM Ac-2568]TCM41135.1 hypothetical protein EV648_112192 [Kribbella sp. VKM Ac-2568]